MGINFSDDNSKFVHHTEAIATYSGYIEFKEGNKTVGKVHAEFDFREMPEEHHATALQMILNGAMTLALPCYEKSVPPPKTIKDGKYTSEIKEKKWFGLF
jgi:hypothetical protein